MKYSPKPAAAIVEEGHTEADFVIVASGPNGASPHHALSERVIEAGDVVVVEGQSQLKPGARMVVRDGAARGGGERGGGGKREGGGRGDGRAGGPGGAGAGAEP